MHKALSVAISAILLSGCATKIAVNKETAQLNFDYQTKEAGSQTGKTVAIVSPEFANASANTSYNDSNGKRLRSAMQSSIEEIISKRGFATKGPYESLDDITYGDRKSLYLISAPRLNLSFDKRLKDSACKGNGLACTENGEYQVSGELQVRLVEPLTGQSMLTKRIDLSSFGITKPYTHQYQNRMVSDGLAGLLVDKVMAPEVLIDNREKALIDAINEFYQKSMAKIDSLLSREEMLSFQQDIEQLKALKRF